jgi:site-specific DNA recombinase
MNKLAAIYVRTSSEHQAEKASPDEQERDCRALAEQQGLIVAAVYRDIERYRVGRRLVDPSGTRADRPGLVAMLNDATAGKFDVILAWKEDRLYRGLRAMLAVLEVIQEKKLNVLLVKESFDPKMAPIKAWVAGMELDALKERMTMGVKARLRAGKANTGQDRYGYQRVGENIIVVEEEAKWVRKIFEWYINRVPMLEIRQRLIDANAPQKGSSIPRRVPWAVSTIQGILKAAKEYAYGIKIQTRAGEAFTISVEPIISEETYQRFLKVREGNKTYPARNAKRDYLAGGLIYCDCNRKWGARSHPYKTKKKLRQTPTGVYFCGQRHAELRHPDCPKTIGSKKADDYVWGRVLEVLDKPDILISGARLHVDELQAKANTAGVDRERLQKELDGIVSERQWVITQARKGRIGEEDMDYQLGQLSMQEVYLKQELANQGENFDIALLGDWEEAAYEFFDDLKGGIKTLDQKPVTAEETKLQFELKRQAVLAIVERVEIKKDRKMDVIFKLDVLSFLGGRGQNDNTPNKGSNTNLPKLAQYKTAGTCSHRQSFLLAHRCAVCGSPFLPACRCERPVDLRRSTGR